MCNVLLWVTFYIELLKFWGHAKRINSLGVRLGVKVSFASDSPKLCLDYIYNQVLKLFNDCSRSPIIFKLTHFFLLHFLVGCFTLDIHLFPPHFLSFLWRIRLVASARFWSTWQSFRLITWCTPPFLCSPSYNCLGVFSFNCWPEDLF